MITLHYMLLYAADKTTFCCNAKKSLTQKVFADTLKSMLIVLLTAVTTLTLASLARPERRAVRVKARRHNGGQGQAGR